MKFLSSTCLTLAVTTPLIQAGYRYSWADSDNYGWIEQGKKSPFYLGKHYQHSLRSYTSHMNKLKALLENENVVLLDVRDESNEAVYEFDLTNEDNQNQIGLKATYVKADYDDIRHDPFAILEEVGEALGYDLQAEGITYDNPKNTIQELRDTKLLIGCGYQNCACRYYFSRWNGWNDVTIVQNFQDYLPGGRLDMFFDHGDDE